MTRSKIKSLPVGTKVYMKEAAGVVGQRPDPDCTPLVFGDQTLFVYHDDRGVFDDGASEDTAAGLNLRPGKPGLFACRPVGGVPYLPPGRA
ncbi:MAG: hypothetical protein E6R03_14645 [Hyphomicrobiaceae bacterium]|nr:MAG: hypothetical protein E6R03_14645 [Hyphomicrobiaceae bacterium]